MQDSEAVSKLSTALAIFKSQSSFSALTTPLQVKIYAILAN
jgi:hypothetical protein